MKRCFLAILLSLVPMRPSTDAFGQQTSFKVLAFYSTKVEPDHVLFAEGALKFFSGIAAKNNFTFDSTSNWDDVNDLNLGKYQVVVWLNDHRFYLRQEEAEAANRLLEAHEKEPGEPTALRMLFNPFVPSRWMNDSYFLPEDAE